MTQQSILSIERSLIAFCAGLVALMLFVNLSGFLAESRISEAERHLVRLLGPWFFSLYSGIVGALTIGAPIGFACGFVCGKLPPYYTAAAAAVLIAPFIFISFFISREPFDASVYAPSVLTAGTFVIASALGARLRLRRRPKPFFLGPTVREVSALHIVTLDIALLIMFSAGIMILQSAVTHGSLARVARSSVFVSAGLPLLFYLRSRVKLRTAASAT